MNLYAIEQEKIVPYRRTNYYGEIVMNNKIVKNYIGVISPYTEDYIIMSTMHGTDAILHTDDDIDMVIDILDKHKIKFEVIPVEKTAKKFRTILT